MGGLLHRGFSALFVGGFSGIIGIDWRVASLVCWLFWFEGWLFGLGELGHILSLITCTEQGYLKA